MKWKIEFVEDKNYVRITTEGKYTPATHRQMGEDFLSKEFWQPGMPVLLDNRALDYSEADTKDLEISSCDMLKSNERIGDSKIAFLISSVESYKVIREFELITEEEVSAWMQVFLDENQALRWLNIF